MSKPAVILAVVPPDALRTAALGRAVELARRTGGTLHLSSFIHDALIDAAAPANAAMAQHARNALLQERATALRLLATECARDGLAVRCDAVWAPVTHESILAKALVIGADYVVKDVGRQAVLRRALFTPLDWKLVRLLPCDLLLVRHGSTETPRQVLAAMDVLAQEDGGESLNARVMEAAQLFSRRSGASLDLVSVVASMAHSPDAPPEAADFLDQTLARHADAFVRFADRYATPRERRHRLVGVPGECIANLVSAQGFDLAVVGNIYRNALERLFLGSTAEVLLQLLECDLLVVKRRDFAATLARHIDLARIAAELSAVEPAVFERVPEPPSTQPGSSSPAASPPITHR